MSCTNQNKTVVFFQVVNPEMYFATCVQDVCACGENNNFCLCDVLEAYASQCKRSGVVLSWRNETLCCEYGSL